MKKKLTFIVFIVSVLLLVSILLITYNLKSQVKDTFSPLPANSVHFSNYLENDLQNSIQNWNKGVVPYPALVEKFRSGRSFFAQGEMWGKAVRSACMFYRYTQDPELKKIIEATVKDLLSTQRENGSISCSDMDKQPDGPGGDLWERKYVLLALLQYYNNVDEDTLVLQSIIDQVDCIISQIGYPPKTRIIDLGWSPNHIESSTLLEPVMKLYNLTRKREYLDFASYIVEEGGAKGYNIIEDALANKAPKDIGGVYPKAYEMMSLFEGLIEYYRVTDEDKWKQASLNLYHNIIEKELTIIGNGGGDQPYHPAVMGEAWDNTALEQTNPDMDRMMETCVGVTWIKLCSQILRLTGDPSTVDMIERYSYNGLLGAMKPEGDGFSYVNLLNGVKTNKEGWGGMVDDIYVTCCNLNGPMGLAYLPFVAVMNSEDGPVVNLYNAGESMINISKKDKVKLIIDTNYPVSGDISIKVIPDVSKTFTVKLRIPAWSINTDLKINGEKQEVNPGSYAEINRKWNQGDVIELKLDMRCRIVDAPHGSNRAGDNFQALIRGPIVLSRDENIDPDFNKAVTVISKDGYVDIIPEETQLESARMQFRVPVEEGFIHMVDYSSVNSWEGKRVCTWLPKK